MSISNSLWQQATRDCYTSALNMYSRYITESGEENLVAAEHMTAEHLQGRRGEQLILGFGKWLFTAEKSDGNHYAPGSIPKYISNFFSYFCHHFPELRQEKELWYDDLHRGLSTMVRHMAIDSGRPIKKATIGIRRKQCQECIGFHLKANTADSFEARTVISILRSSVGRGGEVSTITWDSAYWDSEEEVLTLDWSEEKTAKENEMTFGPDSNDWKLDCLHAIASYLILCPGKARNNHPQRPSWMFPRFHSMENGGAANFTTQAIRKCVGHVSFFNNSVSPCFTRLSITIPIPFCTIRLKIF